MKNLIIEIVPVETFHQPGIDLLYKKIEQEFSEPVFSSLPQSLIELSQPANRFYWVAVVKEKVIGTAGIIILSNKSAVLKSMFLAKEFRGNTKGVANMLLQTAINRAKEQGCNTIYLGTMEQFKAAQRFYEKNDFRQIAQEELPADFPSNTFDTIFYLKTW